MRKWIMAVALLAAVPSVASAQDAENGKGIFKRCAACHQIGEGAKNGLGPSLQCVAGEKAGHLEDFKYSDAVKNSGLEWTDENLLAWFEADDKLIKGNKMIFPAGIKNEADRADLLAYIKSECPK